LRNPTRSDSGTQRVFDLSKSTCGGGRRRAEQAVHAYYRLFKDELQDEINKAFARQDESISQIAHRNRYLAEKLKTAPDSVKEAVEKARLPAGELSHKKIRWADEDNISKEEIERRDEAIQLNE